VRTTIHGYRPACLRDDPRVVLTTALDKDDAIDLRRTYAAAIRRMKLRQFGVFIAPYAGAYAVLLGRHDGGPIVPDADALRAQLAVRGVPC
jgi:hypothetical protein